jgi:hypothetical protein
MVHNVFIAPQNSKPDKKSTQKTNTKDKNSSVTEFVVQKYSQCTAISVTYKCWTWFLEQ